MSNLGFGRDVSCTTSLRPGRFASGARLVGEAALRRLSTPRGTLRGGEAEANYGLDLQELLGSVRADSDAASIGGRIGAELKKDERIDTVSVDVLVSRVGASVSLAITVDASTAEGPFLLTLNVSQLTVELVGLKAEG